MSRIAILTMVIVAHILAISFFLFDGDEVEEKAISLVAQPGVVQQNEVKDVVLAPKVVSPRTTAPKVSLPKTNASGGSFINHVVKPGDYLSTIARKYKTTVARIKQVNKLNSDRIYVGQKLTMPQD